MKITRQNFEKSYNDLKQQQNIKFKNNLAEE